MARWCRFMSCALLWLLLLGSIQAAAAVPAPLEVGAAALEGLDRPGGPTFRVDADPVVSGIDLFAASPDWKRPLFNLRESTLACDDTFDRRRALYRKETPYGPVEQEALLRGHSLELRWRFDLKGIDGNIEINVLLPEATLGVSPYEIVHTDGTREKDHLWVEPRAPLTDVSTLSIETPRRRIRIDAGERRGWQFQDVRRGSNRGQYRMVLPLYNLKGDFRAEVGLRISVDPPDAELAPLDLSAAANMGLADEREGDQAGGWTDQADNDLRTFPTGTLTLRGIPFQVADPARHAGKSVVMLRGPERPYFPASAQVPVGRKAGALYFLHACAWGAPGKTALTYEVAYADGTTASVPVRVGREIQDWWSARDLGDDARVAWRGANARAPIGVMLLRWTNPQPEKEIRSLTLRAGDGPVAGVIAVTAASRPLPLASGERAAGKLPPLAICGAGPIFIDEVLRGTRLDPQYRAADMKSPGDLPRGDLMVVVEELPATRAPQVIARVREGGRLLLWGVPPASLAEVLPVEAAQPPKLRAIAPYWHWGAFEKKAFFLRPARPADPLFAGLDMAQVPPTGAFYEVAARPGAEVVATWASPDGETWPALVEAPAGKGRVVYLNLPRLGVTPDGTDYARLFLSTNRYRDPFFMKLAYHAAGRDDVAARIGRFFQAKAAREGLLSPLADLRVRLESAHALSVYLSGPEKHGAAVEAVEAAIRETEAAIDGADNLLEGFLGDEAAAGYQRAGTLAAAAARQMDATEQALRKQAAAAGVRPARAAAGPPIQVGSTHIQQGMVYAPGPSRRWVYDWALRGMREELGWNVFDVGVGNYGANELRPDGKTLDPAALDDIAEVAHRRGMAMILFTVGGAFAPRPQGDSYTEAGDRNRAEVFRQLAGHLDPLPAFYAFEPNNEPGLGVKPETMVGYDDETFARFRRWLQARHGSVAKVNALLGTDAKSFDGIVPPKPAELAQAGPGSPLRAVWAEWIEFRFDVMEARHRSDYEAIRSRSKKPIFDRTAGDGMNWCSVPGSGALQAARQERRAKWHDALGSHVISPFLLDYQVGMSRGKRIVQSEYYWSTYGGPSDGVRYRFAGNFMHPYLENDTRNFAAVGRNFWKALSRGNDLFTIYFANPQVSYGGYDEGYWAPHTAYWGDFSFKGMTYAMKVYPREANRIRGDLVGARHEPQVGILEPLGSIVHTLGTCIAEDLRDPQYEAEALHRFLLQSHVQTEVTGEWKLLEGKTPAPPTGGSVSALSPGIPPVLLVPYGVYLDARTQERLIAWVRAGGTLVATGPVGLYDGLGKPCARLLEAAFPGVKVTRGDGEPAALAGGKASVRRRWLFEHPAVALRYAGGEGALLRARLGKGEVIVAGFPYLNGAEALDARILDLVRAGAPPMVDADNPSVQLYLCRRGGGRILYALNEDHRIEQRATVGFRTPCRVTDLRAGVALSPRRSLALSLLPGECRVLRLDEGK